MDVNLWFARDDNKEIISIVNAKHEIDYTCPICSSKVIPKALESKKITPHFAHVDKEKCNSESMLHWWFKHKFIEQGEAFKIKTDKEIEFTCKKYDVEKNYHLESGAYRPDLVITTECGNEIIFEMANSNKKKVQDYIDRWIELGKVVVEIDIKSLMGNEKVFPALFYKGKCFNFNKRDGGYYNSIGKLKERMIQDGNYDIEKVKELDWFWSELVKYKENNNELFMVFDSLDYNTKAFIYQNSYKKCSQFFKDCVQYKKNTLLDLTDSECILNFNDKQMCVVLDITSLNTSQQIKIDIITDTIESISKKINKAIEEANVLNKHKIFINQLNASNTLKCALEEYAAYVKGINEQYEFVYKDGWGKIQDTFNISYNFFKAISMKIPERIIHLSKDDIFDYIENSMGAFIENNRLEIDVNQKDLQTINDKIKSVKSIRTYITQGRRKFHRRYITVNNKNKEITSFEYKLFEYSPSIKAIALIKHCSNREILWSALINDCQKYDYNFLLNLSMKLIPQNIKWVCKECNSDFTMNSGELSFFVQKELEMPKRCKSCRKKRKNN